MHMTQLIQMWKLLKVSTTFYKDVKCDKITEHNMNIKTDN